MCVCVHAYVLAYACVFLSRSQNRALPNLDLVNVYLCHTELFKPSFHDTVSSFKLGGGGGWGVWVEELRKRGGEEKGNSRKSREIYMDKRKVIVSDKVVWLRFLLLMI